ncbi:MAG: hypothetical protein ABIF40_05200 [archaeon]
MNTIEHFKALNQIRKEDGLLEALKSDAVQTAIRHPALLALPFYLGKVEAQPLNEGYAEATVGSDGEYTRFVRREPGSDLTIIEERQEDGSWIKRAEY